MAPCMSRSSTRRSCCRACSATPRSGPASSASRSGSCWRRCRPGSGRVAGRMGSRRFLVAGPILMALGLLWFARLPVDSTPWTAAIDDPASFVPPASALHRRAALLASLRPRHLVGRGAADEHLDGLDLGALLGDRLGHQQLDRAGRPAAARGAHLHRDQRHLLRVARLGRRASTPATRRCAAAFQPLNPPAAGATAGADRRLEPGVDGGLPPCDAGLRRAAGDRRIGVVVRPARRCRCTAPTAVEPAAPAA